MIKYPFYFRAGKIGVYDKPGLFPYRIRPSLCFEFIADGSGTAALPHNRIVHGLSGILIPHDGGFALIGNSDCCNLIGARSGFFQYLPGNTALCPPNFHSIVFHPSGLRENLGEFLLCSSDNHTGFIK